jgi:crossover junction endodeoxyribonuclease RuvC
MPNSAIGEQVLIGFDPGLASCGYGVIAVSGSRVFHRAHGVIETDSSSDDGVRLDTLYTRLCEIIASYQPERAAVESLYFAKNISSAIPVAQARGVILLACARSGVPVLDISPPRIKQRITGVGRADKNQVQQMIKLLLGLKELPASDHAADALAAAYSLWQEPIGEMNI